MLDEIREQRLLVCHLCIKRVLIAGARALHSAGITRRGNRQLCPQPGVSSRRRAISSDSWIMGGWGAASGRGGGRTPLAGRRFCFGDHSCDWLVILACGRRL
jgi:hypothetical protein